MNPALHRLLLEARQSDTPSTWLRASRAVDSADDEFPALNIAFLSTFTLDLILPGLKVCAALEGYRTNVYFAPFQQLEQETGDPHSGLHAFGSDFVVLALLLEDISPLRTTAIHGLGHERMEDAVSEVAGRIERLLVAIRQHSTAHIILFNFATPGTLQTGPATLLADPSPDDFLHACNRALRGHARSHGGVSLFDYAALVRRHGLQSWWDEKMWHYARQPLSRSALTVLPAALAQHFRMVRQPRKKCLVLDLDNTLWGGVVGEDGPGGIKFGDDFPGNTYRDFQRFISFLRQEGVLLAIASKNNPDDVSQAFEQRDDFLVRLGDFAAVEIHWEDKAQSLTRIARDLSIGLDSLVFFDDNPAERELVRAQLPEVTVIDVPSSSERYVSALRDSGYFDQVLLSDEDLNRAELYRIEGQRRALERTVPSREEFLLSLQMEAEIAPVDILTLGRCAQLLGKTNQFNLTTRRHSEATLRRMIDDGAISLSLRLRDRFGDLGLVGLTLATPTPDTVDLWDIDSFLLSCRVLGREAETLLLRSLLNALAAQGAREVRGHFIPTAKNAQTREFYPSQGFEPDADDGTFHLNLQAGHSFELPSCFNVLPSAFPCVTAS